MMKLVHALIIAGLAAAPAAAQDYNADPNFGTLNLTSGFQPDPQVVAVRSGGEINANTIAAACSGFISNAPDVRVNYTAGSLPLIISVAADADPTLVRNAPARRPPRRPPPRRQRARRQLLLRRRWRRERPEPDGPLQRAGERPIRHL